MSESNEQSAGSRCMVCGQSRNPGEMLDAVAHAPCDQRAARFPHAVDEHTPGFWPSVGAAVVRPGGYDDQ